MNRSEAAVKRERQKFLRAHGWQQWNDVLWYRISAPHQRTAFEKRAYQIAKREARR